MTKGAFYQGWNTKNHLNEFDGWNAQSESYFNFVYGCFAEQQFLKQAFSRITNPRILDVGCATGTTYRYLRNFAEGKNFDYLGVDLSEPAINRAKSLYPAAKFVKKEHEKLFDFVGERRDIVCSRDTVMHQTDPFAFLDELIEVTDKFLTLRLRTRDHGATVFDVDASCQAHYDSFWMPYIVINTDELIDFLKSRTMVTKITLNRSYEVLGGHNLRYLPKDLYFTNARGAETSVMIELSREQASAPAQVEFHETLEGHAYLRQHRIQRYARAAWSRILRPRKRSGS